MKTIVTTCALLAVLAAPASLAGTGLSTQAITKTCELQATDAGFAMNAQGIARFTEIARGESMAVKVLAKVEDKTLLIVSVGTKEGRSFDVGTIDMVLGAGVFQMHSFRGSPTGSKLFPIDNITAVSVRMKDTVLLAGQCGATE